MLFYINISCKVWSRQEHLCLLLPFVIFAANVANGNTLPIPADYVWKILAFRIQYPLGTTYKLYKIKFHL